MSYKVEPLKQRPEEIRDIKGIWIEVQYPRKGEQFIQYHPSTSPQYLIRIHKETMEKLEDNIVGEYFQYIHDGTSKMNMAYYIEDILSKNGLDRSQQTIAWDHRIELCDFKVLYPDK
jgi:hypothetical protein